MSHRAIGALRLACALLFLSAALLQYNDPDPLRWIAIYLLAMLACIAADRFRGSWMLALAVATVAMGWSVRVVSEMPEWVPPGEMFEAMDRKGGAVEMAREAWGLAIMAVVLLWVSWSARPSRGIAS